MKTIISEQKLLYDNAARNLAGILRKKPDAVLALSAEREMLPLYARLAEMCRSGEICMDKARVFALAEYVGADEKLSCRAVLEENLVKPCAVREENFHIPNPQSPAEYDVAISECGGIDISLVDIGDKGQLAFNEPSTPYASGTRLQKLSADARRQRAEYFGGADKVPEQAVTMGIKTIIDAKEILLIAVGPEKAHAVYKMLYGRNDSVIPAAFLQIPLNVNIYLDEQASSEL